LTRTTCLRWHTAAAIRAHVAIYDPYSQPPPLSPSSIQSSPYAHMAQDELFEINGVKPKVFLADGDEQEVGSMTRCLLLRSLFTYLISFWGTVSRSTKSSVHGIITIGSHISTCLPMVAEKFYSARVPCVPFHLILDPPNHFVITQAWRNQVRHMVPR